MVFRAGEQERWEGGISHRWKRSRGNIGGRGSYWRGRRMMRKGARSSRVTTGSLRRKERSFIGDIPKLREGAGMNKWPSNIMLAPGAVGSG